MLHDAPLIFNELRGFSSNSGYSARHEMQHGWRSQIVQARVRRASSQELTLRFKGIRRSSPIPAKRRCRISQPGKVRPRHRRIF